MKNHYEPKDPDKLLEEIHLTEKKNSEGKLKIFFGMCAGVGKTYSMLEEAQKQRANGVDIVVGLIETHNRAETAKLLHNLEVIPRHEIMYRGATFTELDLDAILRRHPRIVLIDELAHSNIPGTRHAKRYLDVLELLSHGIDVFTTLNVQHIESRSPAISEVTGIKITESVPDSIIERADEIELIDLTPGELIQRLKEGKVYTGNKTKQATENFFRKGNLIVLREMALRITAERVEKDIPLYKNIHGISGVWKSNPKLLVSVGPGPYSRDLIRWTRRLAYSMEVQWVAGIVETGGKVSESVKHSLDHNIALAKELGAEVISIQNVSVAEGLLKIAQSNNVTQIIVGKTRKSFFDRVFRRKRIIDLLLEKSGNIDIYILGGDEKQPTDSRLQIQPQSSASKYFWSVCIMIMLCLILYPVHSLIGYQSVSFILLFAILIMSLFKFGPGPIVLSSVVSASIWNFFFIPPALTIRIDKLEDIMMFAMYFLVAGVSGFLTAKIRTQQDMLDQNHNRTTALYSFSKELASATSMSEIIEISIRHIDKNFHTQSAIFLPGGSELLQPQPHFASTFKIQDSDWPIVEWTFKNGKNAGAGTNTLPSSAASFFPLRSASGRHGVLVIDGNHFKNQSIESDLLFESFLTQVCSSVEREHLNNQAKKSVIHLETEHLYRTLFDTISHELKTPVTIIKSAVDTLRDRGTQLSTELFNKIMGEAEIALSRLHALIDNLLNMTRLETGNLQLTKSDYPISDIINSAVEKIDFSSGEHKLRIILKDENQYVNCDFHLIEQVIVNILKNAVTYTPQGSNITLTTVQIHDGVIISIADDGTGIPREYHSKIFDKFFRVPGTRSGGSGIGLSIAKGFVTAHKGTITLQNSANGGAEFVIFLPESRDTLKWQQREYS